jgi:hypothetical protein
LELTFRHRGRDDHLIRPSSPLAGFSI